MTTGLIFENLKQSNAQEFVNSFGNDNYYMFFGNHIPYLANIIPTPEDSVETITNAYDNMIFGKKINATDIAFCIPRIDWVSNIVYTQYDHTDGNLANENYYVVAPDGANYNVYKCISNNNGGISTVLPSTISVNSFETSDKYIWKYMYSITSDQWNSFATNNNIPVYNNQSISDNAVGGTIEVIKIKNPGSGYNNYYLGTFQTSNIQYGGDPVLYTLNFDASPFNDYYQGCLIKITSGVAADEYREIVSYSTDGGIKKIFLASPFTNSPSSGDTYEIYPYVYIFGDGSEKKQAVARAIVNPNNGNSISSVEMLDLGAHYRTANCQLNIMQIVNVSVSAVLEPIISPQNGHGYDSVKELNGTKICLSVVTSGNESNNIIATNDYRSIGILKNPLFANLEVQYTNSIGSLFIPNEEVFSYTPVKLYGTVNTTSGNNVIIGSNTQFIDSLNINDEILITDNLNSNFYALVTGINSNTSITVSNIPFSSLSNFNIYYLNRNTSGKISSSALGSCTLSNVDNVLSVGQRLIGVSSYTTAIINTLSNNGKGTNSFQTFMQTTRYIGIKTSTEAFLPDETIYQVENVKPYQPTASTFHYVNDGTNDNVYATRVAHIFQVNKNIIGTNSGAIMNLSNKYDGDLVKDSGEILYLENLNGITKTPISQEKFKIILNF